MRLQVRQSKHIRIGNDSTTSVGFKRQIYVPKLNQRMSNALPTRTGRLSVVLLAVGWSLLCAFAPWQQVHPSDNSLVQELSRAPLWTSHYRGLPGARVNALELMLEACSILVQPCYCALIRPAPLRSRI